MGVNPAPQLGEVYPCENGVVEEDQDGDLRNTNSNVTLQRNCCCCYWRFCYAIASKAGAKADF